MALNRIVVMSCRFNGRKWTSADRQSFGSSCVSEVGMKIDDKIVACGVTVISEVIRMLKSVCSE